MMKTPTTPTPATPPRQHPSGCVGATCETRIAEARAEAARRWEMKAHPLGTRVRVTAGSDRPYTGTITRHVAEGCYGIVPDAGQGSCSFAITLWPDTVEEITEATDAYA